MWNFKFKEKQSEVEKYEQKIKELNEKRSKNLMKKIPISRSCRN